MSVYVYVLGGGEERKAMNLKKRKADIWEGLTGGEGMGNENYIIILKISCTYYWILIILKNQYMVGPKIFIVAIGHRIY